MKEIVFTNQLGARVSLDSFLLLELTNGAKEDYEVALSATVLADDGRFIDFHAKTTIPDGYRQTNIAIPMIDGFILNAVIAVTTYDCPIGSVFATLKLRNGSVDDADRIVELTHGFPSAAHALVYPTMQPQGPQDIDPPTINVELDVPSPSNAITFYFAEQSRVQFTYFHFNVYTGVGWTTGNAVVKINRNLERVYHGWAPAMTTAELDYLHNYSIGLDESSTGPANRRVPLPETGYIKMPDFEIACESGFAWQLSDARVGYKLIAVPDV